MFECVPNSTLYFLSNFISSTAILFNKILTDLMYYIKSESVNGKFEKSISIIKLVDKNMNQFSLHKNSNFFGNKRIQHRKCIQVSTSKPSIGSVVLEMAPTILREIY